MRAVLRRDSDRHGLSAARTNKKIRICLYQNGLAQTDDMTWYCKRALGASMQVWPAASSCWPATRHGPADPASSWFLEVVVGFRKSDLLSHQHVRKRHRRGHLSPRACVFCFVSSKDLHISKPPKSRRKSTVAGARASATTPLPSPTPPLLAQ